MQAASLSNSVQRANSTRVDADTEHDSTTPRRAGFDVFDMLVSAFTGRHIQVSDVPLKAGRHVLPVPNMQLALHVPEGAYIQATELQANNIHNALRWDNEAQVWRYRAPKNNTADLQPLKFSFPKPVLVRAEKISDSWWAWMFGINWLVSLVAGVVTQAEITQDGQLKVDGRIKLLGLQMNLPRPYSLSDFFKINMDLGTLFSQGPVQPMQPPAALPDGRDPTLAALATVNGMLGDIGLQLQVPNVPRPADETSYTVPTCDNPPMCLVRDQVFITPSWAKANLRIEPDGVHVDVRARVDFQADDPAKAPRFPAEVSLRVNAKAGAQSADPWTCQIADVQAEFILRDELGQPMGMSLRQVPVPHGTLEEQMAAIRAFAGLPERQQETVQDAEEPLQTLRLHVAS